MNTEAFQIEYWFDDRFNHAEIKPCCDQYNVVDYAVWIGGKLAFAIAKNGEQGSWLVSVQNADDAIDPEMVHTIGEEIDQYYNRRQ